jgi:RimJ/RimL family protein N-acetyltransferase
MDDPHFALGALVPDASAVASPPRKDLVGRHVALTPLDPEQDGAALHAASHGSPDKQAIWTYLPYGPFDSPAVMTEWLRDSARQQDPLFWTVRALVEGGRPVGVTSLLSVVPAMRRLEIGHIWYTPSVQRTKLTTEATYLLLCQAFALGYRRVEWKCNALNVRSRRTIRLPPGRHVSTAHDRARPQPRHRLVRDARRRLAGREGQLRTLAVRRWAAAIAARAERLEPVTLG